MKTFYSQIFVCFLLSIYSCTMNRNSLNTEIIDKVGFEVIQNDSFLVVSDKLPFIYECLGDSILIQNGLDENQYLKRDVLKKGNVGRIILEEKSSENFELFFYVCIDKEGVPFLTKRLNGGTNNQNQLIEILNYRFEKSNSEECIECGRLTFIFKTKDNF